MKRSYIFIALLFIGTAMPALKPASTGNTPAQAACLDKNGYGTIACGTIAIAASLGIYFTNAQLQKVKRKLKELESKPTTSQLAKDEQKEKRDGLITGITLESAVLTTAVVIGILINVLKKHHNTAK